MKFTFLILAVCFSLLTGGNLSAQTYADSTVIIATPKEVKKSSIFKGRPGKSMLMSLVVPGAGQIYNKSYLRVPFVWGTVGTIGVIMIKNTRQYQIFRDAYIAKIDGKPITVPAYVKECIPLTNITPEQLMSIQNPNIIREFRDDANKNKQLSIVIFSFAWLLNGVDAFVDAHLKDFDIDEDLSFKIDTRFEDDPNAPMKLGLFVQF
ncbi:MAG TPA: DUF5683 domain-containing protein [Saprospiraceae bacterium]|nr:DUF5683 domain-containing protein [Saprospiraceae bacterium]